MGSIVTCRAALVGNCFARHFPIPTPTAVLQRPPDLFCIAPASPLSPACRAACPQVRITNAGKASYPEAWTGYNVCASYDK